MRNLIAAIFLILISSSMSSNAQTTKDINGFSRFVTTNYKLPDTLKSNCEWMYAIVKVKTDIHNKIIKYEFVNKPLQGMGKAFDFLIGYQFNKKIKINQRPIVFYMGIDNLEGCTEKPGDKVFYAPNEVASEIWGYLNKVLIDNPRTIFISDLMIYGYMSPKP